jgi:superfamily II DNA/RNA helicase
MINDPFLHLQEVFAGRAALPDLSVCNEGPYRRIFAAIRCLQGGAYRPGPADLAILVRQVLRFEQERQGGASPLLAIPTGLPWPSPAEYERFGLEVLRSTPGNTTVRSDCWAPAWLPGADIEPVDRAAMALADRRDYGEVPPPDPFLDRLPLFPGYRCAGQREAARAVLTAPEGSTLVVNLPTGSGKSLAAYLPALLDPTGLTVVVVPTTALALDQGRSVEPLLGHPAAYFGGSGDEATERNQAIRSRIKAGSQQLVFTSPEAMMRSLATPLYDAARRGLLRALAIDEAHIIDQWGEEFRPEFQEIAGLRRDLLRRAAGAKPITLLLTGTMTESCLDTLETLFGHPGPFGVVSAAQLRPEPSYWVARCADETVRVERVFEAVSHLPRPLILYVSRVQDAYDWIARLKEHGFLRSAAVTGATPDRERAEVVRAWQADEVELVVATSAFGLGIDKQDVRAVIHACLPEHVDRFYQEVGRSGRDGRACVSLLLTAPGDLDTARRLNRRTLISTDEDNDNKGYERWRAMYASRSDLGDGRIRVSLTVIPEYGFGRFENSPANVAWNLRTLALLARAGAIELDAQPPPTREAFADDKGSIDEESLRAELERHRLEKVVRVLSEDLLDLRGIWRSDVEKARLRSASAASRGLALLTEFLEGTRCAAETFAEAYAVTTRPGTPPRPGVFVAASCGGCLACRRAGRDPYAGGMPRPAPPWRLSSFALPQQLARLLGKQGAAFLFDSQFGTAAGASRQRRERFVRYLVSAGFRTIVGPPERLAALRPLCAPQDMPPVFFAEEWEPQHLPATPTLVVDPPDRTLRSLLTPRVGRGGEPPILVWLSADRPDPEKQHCLLTHTLPGQAFRLEEFCTGVGQ